MDYWDTFAYKLDYVKRKANKCCDTELFITYNTSEVFKIVCNECNKSVRCKGYKEVCKMWNNKGSIKHES